MDPIEFARENHAFFFVNLGLALCSQDFNQIIATAAAAYEPDAVDQQSVQMSFRCHSSGEMGYLRVDAKSAALIQRFIPSPSSLSRGVPYGVTGDFYDECSFTQDTLSFHLRITDYEGDRGSGYERIADPVKDLSKLIPLGRRVDLTATLTDGDDEAALKEAAADGLIPF